MRDRMWIEVDLAAAARNIRRMRGFTRKPFMACVKADCYGMGAVPICRHIEPLVDSFGVATVPEALELRESGIHKEILVMGTVLPPDVAPAVAAGVTLTLCNREVLSALERATRRRGRPASVHVKVDTGMGRIGVAPDDVPAFLADVGRSGRVRVDGIFTHLATAEWKDRRYAFGQIGRFRKVLAALPAGTRIPVRHVANSPSILNLAGPCRDFDIVRIGLLIFGVYPDLRLRRRLPLDPVLRVSARVFFVKDVAAGSRLSYGITFTAPRAMRVATLGVGYADGLRRSLSNRFSPRLSGRPVPVVGNICMDQTLVDVTGLPAAVGDPVEILARTGDVERMADAAGTVTQEILCGFGNGPRSEKVYLHGKRADRAAARPR